jgi:putative Ca2+/H+ antiporter (TMEM165/GDT1 family)
MDPLVIALTFGAIFLVELPDKTFIATLVLSTRFRPLLVWIGVGAAFFVQTLIAVGLGTVIGRLPTDWVRAGAAAMFLAGAVLLFREARGADAAESATEEEFAERAGAPKSGFAAIAASFLVLFAAEWGDLSQLLTLSLVAKYDAPGAQRLGEGVVLLLGPSYPRDAVEEQLVVVARREAPQLRAGPVQHHGLEAADLGVGAVRERHGATLVVAAPAQPRSSQSVMPNRSRQTPEPT